MEQANILVPIAMFGCIVVFLILFASMQPRRAVLASFLGAWLFLPIMVYEVEGLPDYSKLFATCFGIMIAVIIFDFKRLIGFRPKWVDIPMFVWCTVPVASSVVNGLGVYDGLSESLDQIILWGIPYFLGRIYFTDWKHLKDLAVAIIISGVVYAPLVLFEMRMSPQLHNVVYGFLQHRFDQTFRFGLWRPMVFMQHGLMLAFWLMTVTLLAIWLWRSGTFRKISHPRLPFDIPFWVAGGLFLLLTIFSVSVNAWLWLLIGLIALFVTERIQTPWLVIILILAIPFYIVTNGLGLWPQDTAVDFAIGLFGPERAQSLEFRYNNEDLLSEKARDQWLFGWAGWDRQLVTQEWGPTTVPDSLWVIVFGKFGVVGLLGLVFSLLLPTIIFIYRYPPWLWAHPNLAPAAAMSVILILYMFDGLLNAMINPLFMLSAGGLLGTYVNLPQLEQRVVGVNSATTVPATAGD